MDVRYTNMSQPPQEALKPITFGALKGKSDINPQWKIEAMTEQFGLCGVGWKFEVVDKITVPLDTGEVMLYMSVAVSVKENGEWSAPAYGFGGDFIVKKNKNGIVPNDEAYKMCLTDALGNALKCFGVAASVYRGLQETKYARAEEPAKAENKIDNGENNQAVEYVRKVGGICYIKCKEGFQDVDSVNAEMLKWALARVQYQAAHEEIMLALKRKGA